MKIKTTKRALDAAIQIASNGVAGGQDDGDIKTHFLFRWQDSKVQVLASNGIRVLASANVVDAVCEGADDGASFTAPAWRVRKFLSTVKKDDESVTIQYENALSKWQGPQGSGKMGSLNPKDFPFWDNTLATAKVIGKVPVARLAAMLNYNRNFVSADESKHSNLVSTMCKDGVLRATDTVGVSIITSPVLADSNLRVHGKDIPNIVAFLAIKGVDEVEVIEHDLCLFLKRSDALEGLLGVSKWSQEIPDMKIDKDEKDKCWFSVEPEKLKDAMSFLEAFALKDEATLRFRFERPNEVVVSVASGAGSDEDDLAIPFLESEGMDQFSSAGFQGFMLTKKYVEFLVNTHMSHKVLRFGLNWVKRGGYVTFRHEQDGDQYFTLVVWARK